jgi:hypothetical protein
MMKMNLPKKNDLYLLVLTIATLPITIYSYLMVGFTVNTHAFFGAAKLVDFYGAFPSNVDMSWESRPIINRMIFYGLYKLFEPLKNNDFMFQIGTKATVAVAILCVCAYFAWMICRKCEHLNVYAVFLISALSFFTLHAGCILEAEFFAALGAIFSMGLLLSESKWANGVAGVILAGVFLIKGLTGVMIPVVLVSCFVFDKENILKKLKYVLSGMVTSGVAFAVSWYLWFPNFIPDILYSFEIVNVPGNNLVVRTYWLLIASSLPLWYIPIVCMGVIASVYIIWGYIRSKKYLMVTSVITLWVLATVNVMIQGEFIANHFTLWIVPSLISILLFLSIHYRNNNLTGVLVVVGITLCVWFAMSSVWTSGSEIQIDSNNQRIMEAGAIKQNYILDRSETILYLDYDSPYFLGNPTACRHTTSPTMVLATDINRAITNTQAYKDEMTCIMNYRGDHIVIRPEWFGINEPANSKITKEYRMIYSGENWDIYKKGDYI